MRHRWPQEQARLRAELLAGEYQISLLSRVTRANGEEIDLWAARDAVVLKALALVLAPRLPASPHCYHLPGRGGAKGAVRAVRSQLAKHTCVLKTDVKSSYASIDHLRLLDRLACRITDRRVLNLRGQYLRRCAEQGGRCWAYTTGMAFGCPLRPILGAFFLYELDVELDRRGVWCARFLDAIVVLPPTRWTLRKAVRLVNRGLATLGVATHPGLGRTCSGGGSGCGRGSRSARGGAGPGLWGRWGWARSWHEQARNRRRRSPMSGGPSGEAT
jgi:hypothetical protein